MLSQHYGGHSATIALTEHARKTIAWWRDNVKNAVRHIIIPGPEHVIASDASNSGWGGIVDNESKARGQWSSDEIKSHINERELKAAYFMLQSLCGNLSDTHIRLQLDNTTAVACINRMASTKPRLMKITKELWMWALIRKITLSAEYLPGCQNTTADAVISMEHQSLIYLHLDSTSNYQITMLGSLTPKPLPLMPSCKTGIKD